MSNHADLPKELTAEDFPDFPGFFDTDTALTRQSDTVEVSVSEAALLLGVTERSVWRRISRKKLVSVNRSGKTFVQLRQADTDTCRTDTDTDTSNSQSDESVTCQSSSSLNSSELLERLAELERKLEGATFRNGYLEAENGGLRSLLDAKDSHIKLLTDSQYKPRWFKKFTSWLLGF